MGSQTMNILAHKRYLKSTVKSLLEEKSSLRTLTKYKLSVGIILAFQTIESLCSETVEKSQIDTDCLRTYFPTLIDFSDDEIKNIITLMLYTRNIMLHHNIKLKDDNHIHLQPSIGKKLSDKLNKRELKHTDVIKVQVHYNNRLTVFGLISILMIFLENHYGRHIFLSFLSDRDYVLSGHYISDYFNYLPSIDKSHEKKIYPSEISTYYIRYLLPDSINLFQVLEKIYEDKTNDYDQNFRDQMTNLVKREILPKNVLNPLIQFRNQIAHYQTIIEYETSNKENLSVRKILDIAEILYKVDNEELKKSIKTLISNMIIFKYSGLYIRQLSVKYNPKFSLNNRKDPGLSKKVSKLLSRMNYISEEADLRIYNMIGYSFPLIVRDKRLLEITPENQEHIYTNLKQLILNEYVFDKRNQVYIDGEKLERHSVYLYQSIPFDVLVNNKKLDLTTHEYETIRHSPYFTLRKYKLHQ
jgi:hypothetical protein